MAVTRDRLLGTRFRSSFTAARTVARESTRGLSWGPLYKFLTNHPGRTTQRIPAYVALIMRYFSHQVELSRHDHCASVSGSSEVSPIIYTQPSKEERARRREGEKREKGGRGERKLLAHIPV